MTQIMTFIYLRPPQNNFLMALINSLYWSLVYSHIGHIGITLTTGVSKLRSREEKPVIRT